MKRMFFKMVSMVLALVLISSASIIPAYAASPSVIYRCHCENIGNTAWVSDGQIAGTQGRGLRMEDLQIKLSGISGGVKYAAHCQNYGWRNAVTSGSCGTTGQGLRMEAVKIELTGAAAQQYDILYRVHVEGLGTMQWCRNGEVAGTTGQSRRIESIEIKLAKKSTSSNVNSKLTDFINDSRFDNASSWSSSKRPVLSSYSSSGCAAYAADYVKYCYNKNSPRSGQAFYSASEIRSGDVVIVKNSQHWIVVISRNGNQLTTAEGNWSGKVVVSSSAYTVQNGKLYRNGKQFRTFDVGYHYQ